jgi:hypothetical protein
MGHEIWHKACDTFKLTTGSEGLHEDNNDNGVKSSKLCHIRKLVVKSMMFPRQNVHKHSWTSPDDKTILTIRLIMY